MTTLTTNHDSRSKDSDAAGMGRRGCRATTSERFTRSRTRRARTLAWTYGRRTRWATGSAWHGLRLNKPIAKGNQLVETPFGVSAGDRLPALMRQSKEDGMMHTPRPWEVQYGHPTRTGHEYLVPRATVG